MQKRLLKACNLFCAFDKIESATSLSPGAGYFDDEGRGSASRWLNPVLIKSFQHLRVLELWPKHEWNDSTDSFPHFVVYLISLPQIQIVDDIRALSHGGAVMSFYPH